MPPPISTPSIVSLKTAISLLKHIQSFLLLSIHSLLHARALYPPATFLATQAFNLAVYQSRHPLVCSWVKDAVSSICAQLATGTVDKVLFAILSPPSGKEKDANDAENIKVLERWVFDLSAFPVLPEGSWKETNTTQNELEEEGDATKDIDDEEETEEIEGVDEASSKDEVNWSNVGESLRGGLRRLQVASETTAPLPKGCTFTIAVELKEESVAPIGYPQPWIPTGTKEQSTAQASSQLKPIRSVSAGPLFFEIYLEAF